MKKLLLIAVIGLQPVLTNAQFTEGNILLGGCLGFNSSTTESEPDDFKTSGYEFSPQVLYFITPQVAAGLNLGIGGTKEKPSNDKTSDFHIGPAIRYQGKWIERASCYGQMNINIGSGKTEEESSYFNPVTLQQVDYTRKDKYSSFGVNVFPGVNYMVKPHFYLDMRYGMLSYMSTTNKPDDTAGPAEDYKTNEFKLKLNMKSLRIGAYYTF